MTPQNYLQPYQDSLSLKEISYLALKPGDIILFQYSDGSRRFGLVVSSRRTSSGVFLSTKGNTLLNVILIDSLSQPMFESMVDTLYRNRSKCSYYSKNVMGAFFGKESFRTFNIAKVTNIIGLGLDG